MSEIREIIQQGFGDYGYFYLTEEPDFDIYINGSVSYIIGGSMEVYSFTALIPTNENTNWVYIRNNDVVVADVGYMRDGPQHYQNCIVVRSDLSAANVYVNFIEYTYTDTPPQPTPPGYSDPKEGDFVTLYSVTPDPLTGGGIFSILGDANMPWYETLGSGIAEKLDLAYYGVISGEKIVSPFVDKMLNDDGVLSPETMDTIAGVILSMYTPKWSRLWETIILEYDPIENYNMTEEMQDDETVTEYGHTMTRTDNLAHSETRTDNLAHSETRTDNLTHTVDEEEKTTPGVTTTRQDATRGFNSNSDVLTDKVTESASGYSMREHDNTEHNTGTQSTQGSDTGTQSTQGSNTGTQSTQGSNTGTQTDADTGSDTQTRNYKLTRSGNIGVTTTQQMLMQQREVYAWNYFYEVVFPDVDKLLTIPTY